MRDWALAVNVIMTAMQKVIGQQVDADNKDFMFIRLLLLFVDEL